MKTIPAFLLVAVCLLSCKTICAQNDSIRVNKTERKVVITKNALKDSARISITGIYHINTMKISILGKSGIAVMEFIPRQIPFMLAIGDLNPGLYYIRCVDKYGRIPSKKMTIKKEVPESEEDL